MPKPVYAIVAVASHRVIGREGRLPWSFTTDTEYFLGMTRGGVMIEGPACYRELGGALPERATVVISRDPQAEFPGATRVGTLEAALEAAQAAPGDGPVWIAGGQWLYEAALPLCERLHITEIGATFAGDRFFPDWSASHPRLLSERTVVEAGVMLRFCVYAKS